VQILCRKHVPETVTETFLKLFQAHGPRPTAHGPRPTAHGHDVASIVGALEPTGFGVGEPEPTRFLALESLNQPVFYHASNHETCIMHHKPIIQNRVRRIFYMILCQVTIHYIF
jgi:hypothetical protein